MTPCCGEGDWVDTVDGIVLVTEALGPGLVATYDLETDTRNVIATINCTLLACFHNNPVNDHV